MICAVESFVLDCRRVGLAQLRVALWLEKRKASHEHWSGLVDREMRDVRRHGEFGEKYRGAVSQWWMDGFFGENARS
jgi:hypothetical protein